jgi:L-iditol 2-dehydrogenase
LIEVKACGICGSDVHGMDGSTGRRIPPVIMGHEASGVIAATGANVKNWQTGDRVTFDSTIYPLDDWFTKKGQYNLSDNRMVLGVSCDEYRRDGAFAELVVVPQHILYKLPDSVSFNQAATVEPAAVAMHAVNLAPVSLNEVAVVLGAGMIGLFVVQVLKARGCTNIICVDLDNSRLVLASMFGADVVLNPDSCNVPEEILKITGYRGADIIYEAVGLSVTINMAVESVRKGGTVTLIGNVSSNIDLPLQSVVTRQIKLQGSCAICGEYPEVLQLMSEGKIDVDTLISASAPLSEGAEWFDKLYNKEPGLMKVILNP